MDNQDVLYPFQYLQPVFSGVYKQEKKRQIFWANFFNQICYHPTAIPSVWYVRKDEINETG